MPTEPARLPTEPGRHEPSAVVSLSVAAALGAGALSSLQAKANGQLGQVFDAAVDAALWSFGSGWLILTLGLLLPGPRRGLREARAAYRANRLRWWQFLGGLGGALFVGAQAFAVPLAGVTLFTIGVVGGQTVTALLVDRVGLGPGGVAPVTLGRVLSAVATVIGVVVAATARGGTTGSVPVGAVLCAVAGGAAIAVSGALNGRVNRASGHVTATSWINFTWGSLALLGWALVLRLQGGLHAPRSLDAPWWAYAGGVLGIVFVAVGAVVVHHLGVLLTALLTIAGQIVMGLVLDLASATTRSHVGPQLLLGVAITLVAAVGAGIAASRTSRAAAPAPQSPTVGG
ncbi:DMT family transporter [Arsenicicoccus piscis]|uniref:DMT family transporter n=1 Tax=Arsenicicoccus piscis TaxID=673954 RepID=A0ABQ6HS00_9MICO|nr:DMT family transporter [Arsenicicoccus piscis]MCH8628165.1 DMT family transporter [Arsenicicoccus piscis]MCH8629385.1 DMT family transporter [Arsenicicoccus piscis]GMA20453.1 hypothetical protein GCM10025862_24740 [Arsenicicoccus piscis]